MATTTTIEIIQQGTERDRRVRAGQDIPTAYIRIGRQHDQTVNGSHSIHNGILILGYVADRCVYHSFLPAREEYRRDVRNQIGTLGACVSLPIEQDVIDRAVDRAMAKVRDHLA